MLEVIVTCVRWDMVILISLSIIAILYFMQEGSSDFYLLIASCSLSEIK